MTGPEPSCGRPDCPRADDAERHNAEVERLRRYGYTDEEIDDLLKDWA